MPIIMMVWQAILNASLDRRSHDASSFDSYDLHGTIYTTFTPPIYTVRFCRTATSLQHAYDTTKVAGF